MTQVTAALAGVRRLTIDSAPLVYFVERHPVFGPAVRAVIERAERGEILLVSSVLKPARGGEAQGRRLSISEGRPGAGFRAGVARRPKRRLRQGRALLQAPARPVDFSTLIGIPGHLAA
jgi:hypothetical protein